MQSNMNYNQEIGGGHRNEWNAPIRTPKGSYVNIKGERMAFNERHSPSKPGASGMLFRSWGTAMRIAPDEMICGNMAFKLCSRRAIKTCPIVTWARIHPPVNKRSLKNR